MGGSRFSFFPHRHGQGVWCQLLGCHSRKDLESPGRIRAGTLSWLGLQGHLNSSSWYSLGHQRHVGGDRDCLCSFIAKLYRVLVGRLDSRRFSVQWIGYLGRLKNLLHIGDEGIQVRI